MKTRQYKFFPCIFCTIGYNSYVFSHRTLSGIIRMVQPLIGRHSSEYSEDNLQLNKQKQEKNSPY